MCTIISLRHSNEVQCLMTLFVCPIGRCHFDIFHKYIIRQTVSVSYMLKPSFPLHIVDFSGGRIVFLYFDVLEFWGLPPLIPLLQYVNRLGFEICSVNRMNNRTRKLGYVNLNWPRCSAWVTESLALTDGSFCQKQNTLYFR